MLMTRFAVSQMTFSSSTQTQSCATNYANSLYRYFWSPDFSRNWDLRIHPCASVRPSVRASGKFSMTIHCIFLKVCMELQLYMGKCNILGFLKIILVATPGALLWLKSPKMP